MSDHEIVWTFDTDCVKGKPICNAEYGADCRLEASESHCECESSFHVEHDLGGAPFHMHGDERH
jgi:hypothetical protein